jgi:hypothetical protein
MIRPTFDESGGAEAGEFVRLSLQLPAALLSGDGTR